MQRKTRFIAPGVILALAGSAFGQMYTMSNAIQQGGQRSRFPADFDWEAIDDAGEGGMDGNMGGRMGGRRSNEDGGPIIFKTDLGKEIQNLQLQRTPASVLAARTKLAQKWRTFLTLEGPPAPPADGGKGGSDGMDSEAIIGMTGMMGGDGESDPADMDPTMMIKMMVAAASSGAVSGAADPTADAPDAAPVTAPVAAGGPANAAGKAAKAAKDAKAAKAAALKLAKARAADFTIMVTAGDWPAVGNFISDFGGDDAENIYTHVLTLLSTIDQAAVPGDVVALSEIAPPPGGRPSTPNSLGAAKPAPSATGDDDAPPMGDAAAEPAAEDNPAPTAAPGDGNPDPAMMKLGMDLFGKLAEADAKAAAAVAAGKPLPITNPVEPSAPANALQPRLSERQIKLLGGILRNTAARGGDPAAVAARIREGTTHFGGPDGGDGAEVELRAQKRKNAATLMMAAGLTVEAQPYLAPLEKAKADKDAELLNLYITYFDALAKKKEGAEKRAVQLQGWDVAMEVLKLPQATIAQRTTALTGAVKLIAIVDKSVGDEFLKSLYATSNGPEVDAAWSTLQKARGRAAKLKQMSAPPEIRTKQLQFVQRLGQAVLAGKTIGTDETTPWQSGLNMLTQAILDEAEVSRSSAGKPQANPYGGFNPFGGFGDEDYNDGGRGNRLQPIPSEELNRLLPDDRWLLSIDPGLAAKLELLVAQTQGSAGDVASVLELIRPIAKKDKARALKLAEALLKSWPAYTKRGGGENDPSNYYGRSMRFSRFGGFFGGYGGNDQGGGIPLTRAQQTRHLAKLRDVISELELMKVSPLPAGPLVDAFAACHSTAEVYTSDDIMAVFGDVERLNFDMRVKLADGMRKRLAGMWRSQQVQQQAGTKRSEQEIAKEVTRGYELAMKVAPDPDAAKTPEEQRNSWQGVQSKADLYFDKAEYLYGRKVDAAVYTELREKAFGLYRTAADMYTQQMAAGKLQPSAKPFSQWFNSSLGASDLGYMTRQDAPDSGQLDLVKSALTSLPPDVRKQHTELFAAACTKALSELNPELKHRYARQAVALLGDVPQAREIKNILSYYDDLTKEVQLNLLVDGSSDVGREPFGAVLSVWSSVSVSRESGGFGKYLNPQDWSPQTGEQVDRREALEKKLRESMGDRFEVLSVTFSKPDVKPMPIADGGREGWEQTVLAYLVLKAKDAAADKLPPVAMEMDFRDTTSTVLLPITSTPMLVDARTNVVPDRRVQNATVEIVLDDRAFAKGTPNAKDAKEALKPGELLLEVKAKGEGLLPGIDKVLDLKSVTGMEVVRSDDHGITISELQQKLGRVIPISERTWTVRMKQTGSGEIGSAVGGAIGEARFKFPVLAGQFATAKLETKRYADADIVTIKPGDTVTLAAVEGRFARLALVVVAVLATIAIAGGGAWLLLKRAAANRPKPAGPRFTMPQQISPVTTLAVLRQIQALNGTVLSKTDQDALLIEIKGIEQRSFAPAAGGVTTAELSQKLSTWIGKAG